MFDQEPEGKEEGTDNGGAEMQDIDELRTKANVLYFRDQNSNVRYEPRKKANGKWRQQLMVRHKPMEMERLKPLMVQL